MRSWPDALGDIPIACIGVRLDPSAGSPCARAVDRVDVKYGPFERSAPEDVPRAKPAPHANGTLRQRPNLTTPQPSSRGRRPSARAHTEICRPEKTVPHIHALHGARARPQPALRSSRV